MAKKTNRFLLGQKIVVGAAIVLAVGLMGGLYLMVLTEAPLGEFVEGEHYTLIENPRRVRGDKVEVMEFFSYACIHCYNFDDRLNTWARKNSEQVEFIRTPAIGSNSWRLLGRAYYTMEEFDILEENHSRLFREIHDLGRNINSIDALASWIDGQGTTSTAFRSMFNSNVINRKIEFADQMSRRLRVSTVPTIIVNGKYMVRVTADVGLSRMLDIMDHLVNKELTPTGTDSNP
ncbi:MAG: thiol:disulfide interchange protein DsbA/DsbL [Pseudomonadales bacterium]